MYRPTYCHVTLALEWQITDTLAVEFEAATSQLSNPANGHDPETVPYTSHSHNLFF